LVDTPTYCNQIGFDNLKPLVIHCKGSIRLSSAHTYNDALMHHFVEVGLNSNYLFGFTDWCEPFPPYVHEHRMHGC